jgi:hypothetical protein
MPAPHIALAASLPVDDPVLLQPPSTHNTALAVLPIPDRIRIASIVSREGAWFASSMVGLSGAGVYAVTASRGSFVLRIQRSADEATFAHRLLTNMVFEAI